MCSSRRPQTEAVYGHKWEKWVKWCSSLAPPIDPVAPSETDLANFLGFLSQSEKLAASTVKGYRSAISTTIRQLGGPVFAESSLLGDIARSLALEESRRPRRIPAWDLYLVLSSLRLAPYEPLESIPFKLLTQKTVFLLALASGRRRSDLHALSGSPSDLAFEPDGSVTIQTVPEFLPKNLPLGGRAPPVRIKALSTALSGEDDDCKLCPVRALQCYLERAKLRRVAQRRLFISVNEGYDRDVSAASVSRWISQTVSHAYKLAQSDVPNPRAHEVRAIAASAAFLHSASLASIMEAAFWRSESTFIQHYLRDLTCRRGDGSFGFSFISADATVTARRPIQ